jgi:hypothetical protein
VYKPGYALWNSKKVAVYPLGYKPKEFNSSKNEVRLIKFEKAAEEWKRISPGDFVKKYPRNKHYAFLGDCFELELDTNVIAIDDVFYSYEHPFVREENIEMRRRYEKNKKK